MPEASPNPDLVDKERSRLETRDQIPREAEHVEDISEDARQSYGDLPDHDNSQVDPEEHEFHNQDVPQDFTNDGTAQFNGWDQSQDDGWDQGQGEECPGCTDMVYGVEAVFISCGHAWHRDCLNGNFRQALLSRSNWPAKCCAQTDRIDHTAIGWVLDDDVAVMLSERQDAYNSSNPVFCSNLECGRFIPDSIVENGQTYWVSCPSCAKTTCKLCKCPSLQHPMPGVCPTFVDKETQELADQEGWKMCPRPGCNSMIERTGGCDTVDCPICKTTFCYRCSSIIHHGLPCNCAGQHAWVNRLGDWMMGCDEDDEEDVDNNEHDEDNADNDEHDNEHDDYDNQEDGGSQDDGEEEEEDIESLPELEEADEAHVIDNGEFSNHFSGRWS